MNSDREIIGLDVGDKRIGVARIHELVGISEPLPPLIATDPDIIEQIVSLCSERQATAIVVGLPRGLDGQETAQTERCREFALAVARRSPHPVYLIDEALSSVSAEALQKRGIPGSTDSLAAGVFLEDFVRQKDKVALEVKIA